MYYMYNIVYRVTHCEINDEVNMQDHQLVRTGIAFPVVDVFLLAFNSFN